MCTGSLSSGTCGGTSCSTSPAAATAWSPSTSGATETRTNLSASASITSRSRIAALVTSLSHVVCLPVSCQGGEVVNYRNTSSILKVSIVNIALPTQVCKILVAEAAVLNTEVQISNNARLYNWYLVCRSMWRTLDSWCSTWESAPSPWWAQQ